MTDSKTDSVTVKNYTDEQVKLLEDASPFDWEGAKVIGLTMGKSPQSIVAKVKNLGLPYTPKPAPRKKAVQTTKTELTAVIQHMIDRDMTGLEKSTRGALLLLINGIQHILPEPVEPELPEIGDSE
jgi:hypothetical protein